MLTSLEEMGARKKEAREGDTRSVISRILLATQARNMYELETGDSVLLACCAVCYEIKRLLLTLIFLEEFFVRFCAIHGRLYTILVPSVFVKGKVDDSP